VSRTGTPSTGARLDAVVRATLEHGIVNTPTLVSTHALLLYEDYQAARRDPWPASSRGSTATSCGTRGAGSSPTARLSPEWLAKLKDAYAKKLERCGASTRRAPRLHIGSDTQQPFIVPGAGVLEEMQLFRSAGIGVEETWAIASVRAGADLPVPRSGSSRPARRGLPGAARGPDPVIPGR
jgi:hypothetical protein